MSFIVHQIQKGNPNREIPGGKDRFELQEQYPGGTWMHLRYDDTYDLSIVWFRAWKDDHVLRMIDTYTGDIVIEDRSA